MPLTDDTIKCELKPLRPRRLLRPRLPTRSSPSSQSAFPSGVCDYSKPGVDRVPTVPWLSYADGPGGKPLGAVPQAKQVKKSCLARRARVRRRGIGRVGIGYSRARVLRRAGLPVRERRRSLRFCVRGGRRGRLIAVLDRRGRARLVATTARGHRLRGVGPGSPARRLGARRRGRVLFGVRRGRVRYVAVVDRRLLRNRRLLRSYLRAAGLAR